MELEILITPHLWLQLAADVRNYLSKEFKLNRSTSPRCVTYGGKTVIESDGHTVDDLRGLNVESMQAYSGSKSVDINELFAECAAKALDVLHPPEASLEAPLEAPITPVEALLPPSATQEPRFCDSCDSKGGRHKKDCPKSV
jgi:hypothetical protein